MNFLSHFPDAKTLLERSSSFSQDPVVADVNGHIHTPFSFSSFDSIPQAFAMAVAEDVKILGINDFYVTDGYAEFYEEALKNKVFPLFNIEFMALQKELQASGIRVNDPNNPGRTYFSGKGLSFPLSFSNDAAQKLLQLKTESNLQTEEMVKRLNHHLKLVNVPIQIDFFTMKNQLARELVRERHIAKALRIAVYELYASDAERKSALTLIFKGKEPKSVLDDVAGIENEIRSALLKTGGPAFVEENDQAFFSLETVKDLIVNGGGIPCYPVLLDDSKGNFTDFEGDWGKMADYLASKGIYSVELIPGRNSQAVLLEFVRFFHSRGFVVLFGTEHNTPDLTPLTIVCRDKKPLSDELKKIGYEGACVVAAHQYCMAKGESGYVDKDGNSKFTQRDEFVKLGRAILSYYFNEFRN
ncbi:MAG: PHP domain-containing protein [Bacteroidota bacterium]|nr:PHP domain-containing protein [Bacteroidota bacterium]MDP4204645.1 PHP domain-containing protein [Bacteroidota bacterium]